MHQGQGGRVCLHLKCHVVMHHLSERQDSSRTEKGRRTKSQGTVCKGRFKISRRSGRGPVWEGRGPPMRPLFGENVCESERIGSRREGRTQDNFVCRSPSDVIIFTFLWSLKCFA